MVPSLHLHANWRKLIVKLAQEGRFLGDYFNNLKTVLDLTTNEIVEKARSIRGDGAEFMVNLAECSKKSQNNKKLKNHSRNKNRRDKLIEENNWLQPYDSNRRL